MQIHQANAKQVSLLYFCDLHIRLIKNTQQINAARTIVYKSLCWFKYQNEDQLIVSFGFESVIIVWSVSKLDENSLLRLATLQLHVATLGHPPVPAADSANYYREYLQARSSPAVTREGWAAAADINIVKLARNVLLTACLSISPNILYNCGNKCLNIQNLLLWLLVFNHILFW